MLDTQKHYTISEAAEVTEYPPHVLRYYEKEFELDIPRNEANHRYYTFQEIEIFQYIKVLQEKGFSNKQIKLIIESPQLALNEEESAALTNIMPRDKIEPAKLSKEISGYLQEEFFNELEAALDKNAEGSDKLLEELRDEITKLRNELNNSERDVLICENAKLKMKVKQKTYENLELKEEINKSKNKQNPLKRLFKKP
ncbi:MAG TPA: MerR family transcriptional regulator [Tissierellales bacterium]|nr:MerR family transcriptional regulator [Tissierellales bacterium]